MMYYLEKPLVKKGVNNLLSQTAIREEEKFQPIQ